MLINQVRSWIEEQNMIPAGSHVLIGLSGGADSTALLLLLQELSEELHFTLEALHVEHGIRGQESLEDAAFARQLCRRLSIPFTLVSVSVPEAMKNSGKGLEETARDLRYEALAKQADMTGARIALAHHADDNAETILFQLARGSGLKGLGGMQPVRQDAAGRYYIRPLLNSRRAEIEAYLTGKGQTWRTDRTNLENEQSRNRIRHLVLPLLEEINSQAIPHMTSTAEKVNEAYDYLNSQVKAEFSRLTAGQEGKNGYRINACELQKLHPAIQKPLILELLAATAGRKKDISEVHIQAVRSLMEKQSGRQVNLPYRICVRKEYDTLIFEKKTEAGDSRKKADLKNQADLKSQPGMKSQSDLKSQAVSENRVESKAQPEHAEMPEPGDGCLSVDISLLSSEEKAVEAGKCVFFLSRQTFDGDMEKIPKNQYTKWFDYDKIKTVLSIRHRRPGDFLACNDVMQRKKLKKYLIDEKIPVSERDKIWLLAQGEEILWVVGGRRSESCKVTAQTERILEVRVAERIS